MKRWSGLLLAGLLAGCGQKLEPQAVSEAHSILMGKTYASEGAAHDLLVQEVARQASAGADLGALFGALKARRRFTWDPDYLAFEVAGRPDFQRPGFSLSGSRRMNALGPWGSVAGDAQELARAIVTKAPDEVSDAVLELFQAMELDDVPNPMRLYILAYYNRELATPALWSYAIHDPVDPLEGRLLAEGLLRMGPLGQKQASEEQMASLTSLQISKPASAAMMYLSWPKPHNQRDFMPWMRDSISKGLAEVEKAYPDSMWILSRRLELDSDPALRGKLGHRWERTPAEPVGEWTGWSALPACTVGLEGALLQCPPEQGENLRYQVRDLLLRGQYPTLEALFAELRANHDPRLEWAYWGCLENPQAVKTWFEKAPNSQVAPVAVALTALVEPTTRRFVKRAAPNQIGDWAVRGATDDPLAQACRAAALVLQGKSPEKLVANSLRRDFLQDRTLEAVLDLAPQSGKALADSLRTTLGNDLAYVRVAGRLRKWEEVDAARFEAALAGLKGRNGYSPGWAIDLLFQLSHWKRSKEAEALLPLCANGERWLAPAQHPRTLKMVSDWAGGKGSWPWVPLQARAGGSWSRNDRAVGFDTRKVPELRTSGSFVENWPGREFGFDLFFSRPLTETLEWKVKVTHPRGITPDNHGQCQRPLRLTPDDPQVYYVSTGLRGNRSLPSGRWTIEVLDEKGRRVAARNFSVSDR